ncbi:phage tail protein I [Vibrio parahaemolyticus]|nr:phage tail protein I [Vibrio parahaemolyticus]
MLPKILRNDIRMRALAELTVEEFNSLRVVIKRLNIMNVYEVDASFLPWLAWWFRVDAWDDEWSEERQRESIANALILKKYKGTIWAVERALELSMFDATVVPWYAMMPEGTRGTFRIDAAPSDSRSLMQSDYDTLISLTESNKQGSQHWKGNIIHDPSLGSAYAAPVVRTRKRWTSNNIVPLHVTGIAISPTSIIVYEGEPVSVSSTVTMSDGTTTHDVRFESSDTSIVTVDGAGLVSYVSEGNASVYAISAFNNISSAECQVVSREAIAPTAVSISGATAALEPGDSGQLVATVSYNNDTSVSTVDNPAIVTWSSSNESVLTIDENGNYVATAFGSVTITATSTEDSVISSSVDTLVYQKITSLTLTPSDPYNKGISDQVGYRLDDFGTVAPDDWLNIEGRNLAISSMRGYRDTSDNSQVFYIQSDYITVPEGAKYFRWLNAEEVMFTASSDTESHSATLLWSGRSYVTYAASDLNAFLRANKGVELDVEIEILKLAE